MSLLEHFPGWEQIDASEEKISDTERAFQEVMARGRTLQAYLDQERRRKNRRLASILISAAAVLALLLIPVLSIWMASRTVDNTPVAFVQRTTSVGEVEEVTLPDQSIVLLNSESVLIYPESFSGERRIFLSGEAIFDVTASAENPFLVVTPDISVRVHGTRFEVKAYPHEELVQTTLARGEVSVWPNNAPSRSVNLLPEQQFTYNRESGSITTGKVSLLESFAWESGELCFRSQSIVQIVRTLERQYGVPVRIMTTRYDNVAISARFIHGETIDEVMNALCAVVPGMHYGWEGNSLYIK